MSLRAAEPWPLPLFTSEPQAVLEAAQKIAPPAEADLFVLDLQGLAQLGPDGRLKSQSRSIVRVVTDAGAKQFSQYGVPWQTWRQEKPTLRLRVITPDGKAHVLDPATITEAGLPNTSGILFTDTKVLSAPVPAVVKGAVIELEVSLDDREVVEPNGRFQQSALGSAPTHHFQLVIESPAGSSLRVSTRGLSGVIRKETTTAETRQVTLDASDIPAAQPLALAPPDRPNTRAILFSTAQSWQQVAQWYSALAEPQIGEPQPSVVQADPLTRIKEIAVILADIQKNVRYTGVELGLAAFRPGKPADTLARGYGDCKDKAALLVSRLRKAGIAANMVLLTPYPADDVSAEMPGMEGFTHAIAYVPGAHPLWIDATAEFAPARRLPWADQGRLALIVDPHTTELVRTPVSEIGEEDSIDFSVLQLSEEGKPSLTLVREDQGGMEDIMRPFALQLLQATPEKRIAAMEQILKPTGAEKVVDVDPGDPKDFRAKLG